MLQSNPQPLVFTQPRCCKSQGLCDQGHTHTEQADYTVCIPEQVDYTVAYLTAKDKGDIVPSSLLHDVIRQGGHIGMVTPI